MAALFIGMFAVSSLMASFSGRLFAEAPWFWLPVSLVATFVAWHPGVAHGSAWRCLVAALACLWGALHGAPLPDQALPAVHVLAPFPWTMPTKTVLARPWNGQVIAVKRSLMQRPASEGRVICRKERVLWNVRRCWLQPTPAPSLDAGTWADRITFVRYRPWIATRLHSALTPWYEALLFGVTDDMAPSEQRALQGLGLFHVISVSGFHFAALGAAIVFLFTLPARVLWVCRLVKHRALLVSHWCAGAAAAIIMTVFAAFIQWPPACQRALILFVLHLALQRFASGVTLARRMTWAMAIQIIFFPLDFWDLSNMLSWLAYLFVVDYAAGISSLPRREVWGRTIAFQVKVSLAAAAFFGDWRIGGIMANFFLAGLLEAIFLGFVAAFAMKILAWPAWTWRPLETLLMLVPKSLAALDHSGGLGGMTIRWGGEPSSWANGVRGLMALAILSLALRAWRRLSLASG